MLEKQIYLWGSDTVLSFCIKPRFTLGITHQSQHIQCLFPSWKKDKRSSMCCLLQSCQTLFNPMDCSPPSSSVHWILQARILEWVAISFSRESSWPRDWTQVSCIAGRRRFTFWATREDPQILKGRSGSVSLGDYFSFPWSWCTQVIACALQESLGGMRFDF